MVNRLSGTAQRRLPVEAVRRRWRLAVLLGLVAFVAATAFAVVLVALSSDSGRARSVLKAVHDIRAGTTIHDDDIATTPVRIDDPGALAGLVEASERQHLVGQVATTNVNAGNLIPAGLALSEASADLWEVPLPVKRMPPELKAGDHVALMVSSTTKTGDTIDFVVIQDVQVLSVRTESASLWLPARVMAQIEWYADHGGVVLAKMPPGVVQQSLPAGGQA